MTLGQRIQELRKKQGLSQEALGEKLGVSRPAISRWEMDGAVPEVDKLIALSKLFGIPVGQLLGVERPGDEEQAEDRELTGRELEVARAVADRCLEGERARRERWKKALWLGAALAGVLALALGVWLFQTYDRLEQEGDEYVLDWLLEDSIGQTYQGEVFRFTVARGRGGLEAQVEEINTQAVPYF
ncbi:helix-turn-helix domain-containing protein [Pseudoflavonifractor phocaeensis]|uniref:helix-turn-helix domain-containing protein n=1 Tax=Pseudoflavonifractor phocaeensis TaxID=1870988 RepID=UPI0022862574|nr:helix-turn-helix transcriptional regulator [Pseudoflavonifractor phocaeensis]MCF2596002.1 helix-turn-helix transcriptional regulator [Pseudoflavonifractor phocaeensis]